MNVLAIIIARAGSKGLPGKNTRPIAGKPCITWTIEAALASRAISSVIVSTDCPIAQACARQLGVPTIERPAALATDAATVDDAARHALSATHAQADAVAILYGNVPVRPPHLIDDACDLLRRTGCDSVQSYARVGKHHPWWTCRVDAESGAVTAWAGDVLNNGVFRRQDLPPAFVPDGGVLLVSRPALLLELGVPPGPHAFLGRDRRGIVTDEGDVVDIDTGIDALVADAVLRRRGALAGSVA